MQDKIIRNTWLNRLRNYILSSRYLPFLVIIPAAFFNVMLQRLNVGLSLPFFLDSIFTAITAALFGIFPGVATGIITNLFMEIDLDFGGLYWQWGLCNAATGFIVGVAAKKGYFSSFTYFLITAAAVTLANSLLGAVIAVYVFGGVTGSPVDFIVMGLAAAGRDIFSSAFLARLITNLVDKSIAVGIAFGVYRWVRGGFYQAQPLF